MMNFLNWFYGIWKWLSNLSKPKVSKDSPEESIDSLSCKLFHKQKGNTFNVPDRESSDSIHDTYKYF